MSYQSKDVLTRAFRSRVTRFTGVGYRNIQILHSEDAFKQGMQPYMKHVTPGKGTVYLFGKPHPNAAKGKQHLGCKELFARVIIGHGMVWFRLKEPTAKEEA